MEPIVSPWLIYALQVVDNLISVGVGSGVLMSVVVLVLWAIVAVSKADGHGCGEEDSDNIRARQLFPYAIKTTIAVMLFWLLVVFIPSSKTLLGMYAASQIPPDNVKAAVMAGKDFKEEIKGDVIDIIQSVQEDKED